MTTSEIKFHRVYAVKFRDRRSRSPYNLHCLAVTANSPEDAEYRVRAVREVDLIETVHIPRRRPDSQDVRIEGICDLRNLHRPALAVKSKSYLDTVISNHRVLSQHQRVLDWDWARPSKSEAERAADLERDARIGSELRQCLSEAAKKYIAKGGRCVDTLAVEMYAAYTAVVIANDLFETTDFYRLTDAARQGWIAAAQSELDARNKDIQDGQARSAERRVLPAELEQHYASGTAVIAALQETIRHCVTRGYSSLESVARSLYSTVASMSDEPWPLFHDLPVETRVTWMEYARQELESAVPDRCSPRALR